MNRATFWSERLLVAMPAAHALAEREWVQWYDLRNETFLLTASDPGPESRDMVLGRLSAFGVAHVTRASRGCMGHEISSVTGADSLTFPAIGRT